MIRPQLLGLSAVDYSSGIFRTRKEEVLLDLWSFCGRRRRSAMVVTTSAIKREQDHYAVLGVSSQATASDIKKAYRLLARKYHPDVSKDLRSEEIFKSVRHAYEVLSNNFTRAEYDGSVKFQDNVGTTWSGKWSQDYEFDEGIRIYRWAELRQRMWEERRKRKYAYTKRNASSFNRSDTRKGNLDKERGSFVEVLRFAFFSLLFMQTFGTRISLTITGAMAMFDRKLDVGYKVGHLIAWVLGGRGGILLALCISVTSWLCGKTSSSSVALVVTAMWVGIHLARFAPFPHGALLTLLYMSIKLQEDSR